MFIEQDKTTGQEFDRYSYTPGAIIGLIYLSNLLYVMKISFTMTNTVTKRKTQNSSEAYK